MSTDKHTIPSSHDLCACGHGRAMHFDEDGDHNGPCLWQVHSDAPFCKCDMWHRKPGEDEFLGVPVSEWNQIRAEINCRRGPDGSLLKRFRELLEVSDMRAALLKKRSAQGVDVERIVDSISFDIFDELQEYAAAARTDYSVTRSERMTRAETMIRRKFCDALHRALDGAKERESRG